MKDCCEGKSEELAGLAERQRGVLWIALAINAALFVLEVWQGVTAHSTSLLSDALDMFGDSVVYGMTLAAIGGSALLTRRISRIKATLMALFAVSILIQAITRAILGVVPVPETMGWVATLALIGNAVCAALLLKHRGDDINMRATWLCSRNDVIANIGVLSAAGLVALTGSLYPDLVVGVLISGLVLSSAFTVFRDARTQT